MDVYPLIFEPIFKERIWGGRRLETLLRKRLPPGRSIGESWELSDVAGDVSIVSNGPAKGRRLSDLVSEWGAKLTGRADLHGGRFPLLIKFLDARETLSVQVHPSEKTAAESGGRLAIKNEAWYVMEASEDSFFYHGLRNECTKDGLREALRAGSVESALRKIPARKGHCFYLPSGTVHALGKGIVVAEVQTPSDVTFRLFDWNRVDGTTGRGRELHVEEGLDAAIEDSIDAEVPPEHTASVWTTVSRLAKSPSFVIERVRMVEGVELAIPYEELAVWIVLEGKGTIECAGYSEAVSFTVGDTVLLPAGLKDGGVRTQSPCVWLEVTIPSPSSLAAYPRLELGSRSPWAQGEGAVVPLGIPKRNQ